MCRFLTVLAIVFCFALPAMADDQAEKDMSGAEWKAFKEAYLARKADPKMRPMYPGCYVCTSMPGCRDGFRKTGFTDMVNYVVVNAWGDDSPGAGGYVRMMTKTIYKDSMCVHDHVKASVCNPMK